MPRIPDDALACSFYLYSSRENAERGSPFGGTGFAVLSPSDYGKCRAPVLYGITNWHLAVRGGHSVVRLNTIQGEPAIFEFGPEDWVFKEGGDDVAVIELQVDPKIHAIRAIPAHMLATQVQLQSEHINAGEDVFMIGRFVDHDGGETNKPAVRFGNISVMPTPIRQPNGRIGNCYCVDMHSRSGYSGSPVFAFRTFGQDLVTGGSDRTRLETKYDQLRLEYRPLFVLLGIHCAQFPEAWEIVRNDRSGDAEYVKGFSGMTVVVPSWSILDLLNDSRFADAQRQAWEKLADQFPILRDLGGSTEC